MRAKIVMSAMAFFLAIVVLVVVLFGPDILLPKLGAGNQGNSQENFRVTDHVIADENAHFGTDSWRIPAGKESTTQIQAYARATSVSPGQRLTFYVSTQKEGIHYFIQIYRLGWYEGYGGRLIAAQENLVGHAQGYYDPATHHLVSCTSCFVDSTSGLIEARWKPSYELVVQPGWTTGIYLAKFTDADGMQTYVPFDVRGNYSSRYVAVTPDTTYAAYNNWGGSSLYEKDTASNASEKLSAQRAVKVSFERPYVSGQGSDQVLLYEINAIHWLERQGYDLSYISNVDLHEYPAQLLHHRVYLSLGHDEYWTKEMRDGVEYARNNGVSLAFLGANASYWQMRFEPDSAGLQNRTVVCYKVETGNKDLARDPLYNVDNSRVTTLWRDPLLARPENELIGIMYSSLTLHQTGFPWRVSVQTRSKLLDGTDLLPGRQYGCDLVGYEWDRIFTDGVTPNGLQVLGASSTLSEVKGTDISNTTYYIAPSGAMVFATGSIYWTSALDNYRLHIDTSCPQKSLVVPGIQKLMARVMDALAGNHSLL